MPKMIFVSADGQERHEVDAPVGLSVLEIAHRNDIDIEGACEGSLACSTCHVIVEPVHFDKLDEASEEEEDMLDLAVDIVVPGHGPITDKRGVRAMRDYLVYVRDEAKSRFDAGMSIYDAALDISLADYDS